MTLFYHKKQKRATEKGNSTVGRVGFLRGRMGMFNSRLKVQHHLNTMIT